ncbi:hypothetical protein GBA52_008531 [Prunus armeniaca]|nr:hypothetical protein GBA52_008531 [Prunus armeniaca]
MGKALPSATRFQELSLRTSSQAGPDAQSKSRKSELHPHKHRNRRAFGLTRSELS